MPRREKFSKSPYGIYHHGIGCEMEWGQRGEEEEDAVERKGFWDGVDLHLGTIEQKNTRKREGKRDTQKRTKQINIRI